MTDSLETLDALRAAATPGEWAYLHDYAGIYGPEDVLIAIMEDDRALPGGPADAAFIVAACNAVGPLIERVREAEADVLRYGDPLTDVYERDGVDIVMRNFHDLRARLAALEAGIRALADEWASQFPTRQRINREGVCDGCAESRWLVASYPEPDNDPWLCVECDDEMWRHVTELRALLTKGCE